MQQIQSWHQPFRHRCSDRPGAPMQKRSGMFGLRDTAGQCATRSLVPGHCLAIRHWHGARCRGCRPSAMKRVSSVNVTRLPPVERAPPSLMRTAEVAAGQLSVRIGFAIPVEAAIEVAVLAALLALLILCCAGRSLRRAQAAARSKRNDMIVAAAVTHEDDGEEHELEKHTRVRGAALSESDLDDDACIPRVHAPASVWG